MLDLDQWRDAPIFHNSLTAWLIAGSVAAVVSAQPQEEKAAPKSGEQSPSAPEERTVRGKQRTN